MFHKKTLKNGLRVIITPLKNTRAITILILIGAGSKYENRAISGISHLLEHMAFKGTKKRPQTLDIAKELDRVGGVYNAFTGKEFMGFWVKVGAESFDLSCDVLTDMLFHSLFRAAEIEKEKKVIFEEINMIKDSPQKYIDNLWEKLLYGDQPAGWMISGEKETVAGISRKKILDYLKNQFVSQNVVISVAGKADIKKTTLKIGRLFNKIKEAEPLQKKPVVEKQNFPQVSLFSKKTDQTHLCLGVRTFDFFRPEKYALSLSAGILGGIMSSRLFIKIREKKSLAYSIKTSADFYSDTGYLVTYAGVDSKRVIEAIKIILSEYKNLGRKRISQKELSRIKENAKGRMYLELEKSDDWAFYTGFQEVLRKEILSPEEECKLIEKVTQDDILEVARDIFRPEKLNLALIGPFKEKSEFEKMLQKF